MARWPFAGGYELMEGVIAWPSGNAAIAGMSWKPNGHRKDARLANNLVSF